MLCLSSCNPCSGLNACGFEDGIELQPLMSGVKLQCHTVGGGLHELTVYKSDCISDIIKGVKEKLGEECIQLTLVYEGGTGRERATSYRLDSPEQLMEILTDVDLKRGSADFLLVKESNLDLVKDLLGNDYLGEDVWNCLGVSSAEEEGLPKIGDDLLIKVCKMHEDGERPLLMLDLGYSIAHMESLCGSRGISVLHTSAHSIRDGGTFDAGDPSTKSWLLVPGSDYGVLPDSREKTLSEQFAHMDNRYPGCAVGAPRMLVTLSVLKYVKNGEVLFPSEPFTFGRAGCATLGGNESTKDGFSGIREVGDGYYPRRANIGFFGVFRFGTSPS